MMKRMTTTTDTQGKRQRGRPVEKPLPPPIPDSPENIARAVITTPPKRRKDWKYLKARKEAL